MPKKAEPVVHEAVKEPIPGETWVHEDGTEVIVAQLGWLHNKRQEDGEYREEFEEDQIGWWAAKDRDGSTSFNSLEAFLAEFTYVPDAQQRREELLATITSELGNISKETRLLESHLKTLSVASTPSTGESSSTAIALTTEGGVQVADTMKRAVAKIRNDVQRNALRIKAETEKMASVMRLNVMAVKAQMEGIRAAAAAEARKLSKMVAAAEEVVWTFNLYLGKEETIELLRAGKPADKSEKIAIRQLTLFMDEESALFADKGGIDFKTMEEFDRWLLESPEHMNQVLPNVRGIVAIRPRRKSKEYTGDPRIDALLNKMNHHTYFLIRNGEQVFRIDTDLEVGETLLPRSTEFVELFEKTVTDWGRHGRSKKEKKTIRPGDEEYMEAMEKADAKQKHYMRVFLFIQGLLDRTVVFHPFEVMRVNVFDMMRQDEHLQFVLDAETGRMLGDGRPSFDDWREEINGKIEVGMRVMGFFRTSSDGGYSRSSAPRTHPAHMNAPSSEELHTIIRQEGDRLYFRYARTDPVYRRRQWYDKDYDDETPKRRVSIYFRAEEESWIAFDLATAEDMEYYLRSRQNRYQYEKMFPVLKKAIQLKKQEEKTERPFREALAGALMRDHGITQEAAQKEVGELVHWWKYKNKTHRALLSDDEKASRMILNEYALRTSKAAIRSEKKSKHMDVADLLTRLVKNPIAIYHKTHNLFVVFQPENDKNIFTIEQLWRVPLRGGSGSAKVISEKRWSVPQSKRLARYELLEHRERWNTWQFDADPNAHLTDEEAAAVFKAGMDKIKSDYDPVRRAAGQGEMWHDQNEPGVPVYVPIATYLVRGEWQHWFWARKALVPKVKKLTGRWGKPVLMQSTIGWTRIGSGAVKATVSHDDKDFNRSPLVDPEHYDDLFGEQTKLETLWIDQSALEAYKEDWARFREADKQMDELRKELHAASKQVQQAMKDVLAVEVRRKFDADYGAPDLWDAHLATFKFPNFKPEGFEGAVQYVVERGIRIYGMTVGEIIEKAKTFGFSGKLEPDRHYRQKDTIYLPPMEYVLQPPPIEAETDEDSEEEEYLEEEDDD